MFFTNEFAKLFDRPIDIACNLIENVLDVPTKKFGDLLGDNVSYWQWRNRIRIFEKANDTLKRKGLNAHKLPLEFAVPLLRDCGDSESEDLQEWWAEMLCSAVEDEKYCHIAFIGILKSMSVNDVIFLDTLLNIAHVEKKGRVKAISEASELSEEKAFLSFCNLVRLGLFVPIGTRLTEFAFEFLRACSPNRNQIDEYIEKQSKMPIYTMTG